MSGAVNLPPLRRAMTFAVWFAACFGACSYPPLDTPVDSLPPDSWDKNCVLPEPLITTIDAARADYSNSCLHGNWSLQSLNGTTMPVTVGQAGNTAIVRPTAIDPGFNSLDRTSTFAVHVSGSGQQNAGETFSYAQLSASLNTYGSQVGTVDASAYTGVAFDAIVITGPDGARLRIPNLYTDPAGEMCMMVSGPTNCYDHPGVRLAPSTAWMRYEVPFATLTQVGFGNPSPVGSDFPSDAIILIRWEINIPAMGATEPWELWVDNVTFY